MSTAKKPKKLKTAPAVVQPTGTVTRTFSLRRNVDAAIRRKSAENYDPSVSATVNRLLAQGLGLAPQQG